MPCLASPMNVFRRADGETAFELSLIDGEVGPRGCQLALWARRRDDEPAFTVDWGDGTRLQITTAGQTTIFHNYMAAGTYVVRFDRGLAWFRLVDAYALSDDGPMICRPNVRPLRWGDRVQSGTATYAYWTRWYADGKGVWGTPPPWGGEMEDAVSCYAGSKSLAGHPQPWPASMTRCASCYMGTSVTGRMPCWTSGMTDIGGCYSMATGVTGRIPPWPPSVEAIDHVYEGATGIDEQPIPPVPHTVTSMDGAFAENPRFVGDIPPWPPDLEWANETYHGCTGLTGAWTDDPALLMPAGAHHLRTVEDASPELRALFDAEWGGTRGPA